MRLKLTCFADDRLRIALDEKARFFCANHIVSNKLTQKKMNIFYNERGETRTWFVIVMAPVALLVIALMILGIAVLLPILIIIGIIGASCNWLSEIGRK